MTIEKLMRARAWRVNIDWREELLLNIHDEPSYRRRARALGERGVTRWRTFVIISGTRSAARPHSTMENPLSKSAKS